MNLLFFQKREELAEEERQNKHFTPSFLNLGSDAEKAQIESNYKSQVNFSSKSKASLYF